MAVTLDSIRLDLVTDTCELSRLTHIKKTHPDGYISDQYQLRGQKQTEQFGLNSLKVSEQTEGELTLTLDLSAKILGSDYHRLITNETLEQVASTITDTGLARLTADDLSEAVVRTADITTDVKPGGYDTTLTALSLIPTNRYNIDHYKTSVIFRSKAKTTGERATFYAKQPELLKGENKAFVAKYPEIYSSFTDTLRVEQNCTSFSALRRAAGVRRSTGQVTLKELLDAPGQPNLEIYRKIRGSATCPTIFDDAKRFATFPKMCKRLGFEQVAKACSLNEAVFTHMLREHFGIKGNLSRYKAEFREVVFDLKAEHEGGLKLNVQRLTELDELLQQKA